MSSIPISDDPSVTLFDDDHIQEALFNDISSGILTDELDSFLYDDFTMNGSGLDNFALDDTGADSSVFNFAPYDTPDYGNSGPPNLAVLGPLPPPSPLSLNTLSSAFTPDSESVGSIIGSMGPPDVPRKRNQDALIAGDDDSSGNGENPKQRPHHRKKKAKTIPDKVWDRHKPRIVQLYMTEDMKLQKVKDLLEQEAGFKATKKQFSDQLKDWGCRKNVQPREKEAIIRKYLERENIRGKRALKFSIRGVEVPVKKTDRWLKDWLKNRPNSDESVHYSLTCPSTPSAVFCRTISGRDSSIAPSPILAPVPMNPSDIKPSSMPQNKMTMIIDLITRAFEDLPVDRFCDAYGYLRQELISLLMSSEDLSPLIALFPTVARHVNQVHVIGFERRKSSMMQFTKNVYRIGAHIRIGIFTARTVSQLPFGKQRLAGRVFIDHLNNDSSSSFPNSLCASVELSVRNRLPSSMGRNRIIPHYTYLSPNGRLFQVVRTNDIETLNTLFKLKKATPNDESDDGKLLEVAAEEDYHDMMVFLLQQDAVIDGRCIAGVLSPIWRGFLDRWSDDDPHLFLAEEDILRYKQVSDLAIENGSSAEYCVEKVGNLIHFPCQYTLGFGYNVLNSMIQYFIRIGCNIEFRNDKGFTPLLEAASTSWVNKSYYISALIENGADIQAETLQGFGPLHRVVIGYYEALEYQGDRCNCRQCVTTKPKYSAEEVEARLLALLNAGCNPFATDRYGKTAVEYIRDSTLGSIWDSLLK